MLVFEIKFLRLILGVSVLLSVSGQAAERLPFEYFAKPTDYHDVQISPDGKTYAIRFEKGGQKILAFIERKNMKLMSSAKAFGQGDISSFRWVNDERVTYEVSIPDSYLEVPLSSGNLYAVSRSGAQHEVIFGVDQSPRPGILDQREKTNASFRMISRLPDEKKWILIAEYPYRQVGRIWTVNTHAIASISKLNVYSGRKRTVDKLAIPGARALVDSDGKVRVAVGVDESSNLVVQWRPEQGADWESFNMQSLGINSAIPVMFTNDNESMFLSGQPKDGGPLAIYKVNLANESYDMVYQDKIANTNISMRDIHDDSVVMLYTEPGLPHYEYLKNNDNDTVRLHKSLRAAFKGQDVRITSHTDDGKEMIVYVYSSVNPGEYYIYNKESNKVEYLFSTKSWVDSKLMRPQQAHMVTARDGLQLSSYLTLPNDNGEPAPMVVMVHGGPHGPRDWWGHDPDVQFLANRGYAVLQVNFRGSGGFGPNFESAGHGEWGGKMQDDITDATRWAIEQGYADADRICIYGGSYGGYASLMGVAKEPDLYQCAIGYAGVYDLATMFERGDIPEQRSGVGYLRKVLGTNPANLAERSPAQLASQIKAKVLLAHGGNDERVPVEHARMMRKALEESGNAPEWLLFEREGHGFFDVNNRIELYRRMEQFLDQNIGQTSAVNQEAAVQSP